MHSGVLGDTVERLSDRLSYALLYGMRKLLRSLSQRQSCRLKSRVFLEEKLFVHECPIHVRVLCMKASLC